jgi:hypothetical protein
MIKRKQKTSHKKGPDFTSAQTYTLLKLQHPGILYSKPNATALVIT